VLPQTYLGQTYSRGHTSGDIPVPKHFSFNTNVSLTQYKMQRNLDRLNAVADDLVAKSFQLYGCFSQVGASAEHTKFMKKTTDVLREMAKTLKTEAAAIDRAHKN
jgi:uncharacterized phage infection (PIP) family protein YhgE